MKVFKDFQNCFLNIYHECETNEKVQVSQQYLERKPHADLHTAEICKLYRCVLKKIKKSSSIMPL